MFSFFLWKWCFGFAILAWYVCLFIIEFISDTVYLIYCELENEDCCYSNSWRFQYCCGLSSQFTGKKGKLELIQDSIVLYRLYFQGLSFVTVFFNGDELPKATGQFMFLEFKESYDYCLLPSYSKEGRLMSYSSRPAFVNLFRYSHEISKVHISILHKIYI